MAAFTLAPGLSAVLGERLPQVAAETIGAVMAEVPEYRRATIDGPMGATIEQAVQMALEGFLRRASRGADAPASSNSPVVEGAYALGRGEARSGRSADALLSAYRVGARVAWRQLAALAVAEDVPADQVAFFAEEVFAYIDELSAASVAGHADETATTGRVLARYRERLARSLLRGEAEAELVAAAERAAWPVPRTLTAIVLPASQVRRVLPSLSPETLVLAEDLPRQPAASDLRALLVPDVGRHRGPMVRSLAGRSAAVGPARPWLSVSTSYSRAIRALALRRGETTVDTERHLAELVLSADPEARADLRAAALKPLDDARPSQRAKLEETLRLWLLHQGRREAVADALFVHPQTVRYRLGQLRELYGDRLDDPDVVRDLMVALA